MKRMILASLTALALLPAVPAGAADLGPAPAYKAPVAAPVTIYNWTGIYIGGHVGWSWANKEATEICPGGFCTFPGGIPFVASTDPDGFLGGGQIGVNWQGGPWVFGIEGDWSWTNADGCGAATVGGIATGITGCTEVKWYATATGRLGYAFDNLLLYAKGGAAFTDEDHRVVDTAGLFGPAGATLATGGDTRTGWTAGAGLEYGFAPNWSTKIEYNYMDFGTKSVTFTPGGTSADIDQQVHAVKFGLNYRWNWGGGPAY